MAEFIDVLDDSGLRTGEVLTRSEIHRLGKPHRAVHLYLINSKNQILLQRRAATTDHYPNMFGISVTGHIDAGECSGHAVYRELREELGIETTQARADLLFSFRQDAHVRPDYIDRQFNDVYVCNCNVAAEDIRFDPSEVSEVKFMDFSEFTRLVENQSAELAPVYARESVDVVYFLRGRLA